MATRNIRTITHYRYITVPLLANANVKVGEIIIRTDATGFCRNTAAASCTGVGIATEDVDNTGGGDGAKSVQVAQGVFLVENIGGANAVVAKDVGGNCFFENANAVGNDSVGKSPVGEVVNLGYSGETGVGVRIKSA